MRERRLSSSTPALPGMVGDHARAHLPDLLSKSRVVPGGARAVQVSIHYPFGGTMSRIDELLGQMALEEKISMLAGADLW
ncbi:MAG TPA: hypothetical protein VGA72_09815, partial [Anaerolineales bacterium]